jgi:hypothetical protein
VTGDFECNGDVSTTTALGCWLLSHNLWLGSGLIRVGVKRQIANVFSLARKNLPKCPLDSFHGSPNVLCGLLIWARGGEGNHLKRVADMVIHEPYHLQFPDNVLPLPSLVKKHQNTNPDSDERISHDCDKQSLRMLVQPEIRQTPKGEDANAHKDAPQRSNPTRTCTEDDHRGYFATVDCYWSKIKTIPTCRAISVIEGF